MTIEWRWTKKPGNRWEAVRVDLEAEEMFRHYFGQMQSACKHRPLSDPEFQQQAALNMAYQAVWNDARNLGLYR